MMGSLAILPVLVIILFSSASALASGLPHHSNSRLETFSFASCNDQMDPQIHWKNITQDQPQFFLWLGDSVYSSTEDPNVLHESYQRMLYQPDYAEMVEQIPVIGTWDDHDYGARDGGRDYIIKQESQQAYLDFLQEPKDSPRRKQEGIYTSYEFGPYGQKAKVILLDSRYFRDTKNRSTILGQAQWRWLEEELRQSSAQIHFIVSSTSVLLPQLPKVEQWVDYKEDRRRLFRALKNKANVFFLTGDLHMSGTQTKTIGGKTYVELMSSGMTHNVDGLAKFVISSVYNGIQFFENNYSRIKIDWDADPIQLRFEIVDQYHQVARSKIYPIYTPSMRAY